MKWLVLGGTKFLGRAFVEQALEAGHEVTLFNRGKTGPALFPDVETITGDRTNPEDLAKLAGRKWDAVFDPSAYVPRVVRMSVEQLRDSVDFYVFVSSISAYRNHGTPQQDESYPVAVMDDPASEDVNAYYGALKALCEEAVEAVFPGRALHIRAGLIVGPYDPTDRFTYWPARLQRGGEFLAPEGPEEKMQFIDARDIADWTLRMAEAGKAGVYNVTGSPVSLHDLFAAIQSVTGVSAAPVYMDTGFLEAQDVHPWQEVTMWIPASNADFRYMNDTSVAKAQRDGLTYRPVTQTVRDLLAWDAGRDHSQPAPFGLPAEKEQAVLAAWRLQQKTE